MEQTKVDLKCVCFLRVRGGHRAGDGCLHPSHNRDMQRGMLSPGVFEEQISDVKKIVVDRKEHFLSISSIRLIFLC